MSTLKSRYKISDWALISVRPPATGAANIGDHNFTCLFQRAETKVNKYKCAKLSTKAEFFPGESILRFIQGINITTRAIMALDYNQSEAVPNIPGKREHDYRLFSKFFSDGGGTSVHRLFNFSCAGAQQSNSLRSQHLLLKNKVHYMIDFF